VRFLLESGRDAALLLAHAQELPPDVGLHQYLLGRQLIERGLYARAAEALEKSRQLGLPDGRFVREADRLSGVARFREGNFAAAAADFRRLAEGAPEGVRLVAADWLSRMELHERTTQLAKP
jgi:Flp pilus assembly protein TadD